MARPKRVKRGEADMTALLKLASERTPMDMAVARSAVRDALRLSQSLRVRIPLEEKRKLCRSCFAYLVPGVTSTVRTRNGRVIIRCTECNAVKRLQFRRGKK